MRQGKNIIRIALVAALILMVPLVAMQFTDEVDWGLFDFVVMGTLLFSAGIVYELAARKTGHRVVVGFVVAAAVFIIWAELAVGIFGTPFSGQ